MNHVNLSGEVAATPVAEGDFWCCVLRFTKHDTIKVIATGSAGGELACFGVGEGMKLTGRLIRHRNSGVIGVLAESVSRYPITRQIRDCTTYTSVARTW